MDTAVRRRWKANEAEVQLGRWRRSGQSLQAYCRGAGLRYERLRRWRGKLENGRALGLRELRVVGTRAPASGEIEIALPRGEVVRVQGDFDPERIVALVRGLVG
jgi:hypothetical protein